MEINNIIKFFKERAQKEMRRNIGVLEPKMYFIILYPEQKTPVFFPIPCSTFMESDYLKSRMSIYSQACWNKRKAESPPGIKLVAVCLISEAWMTMKRTPPAMSADEVVDILRDNDPNWAPSNDNDRQEVLKIDICFPDNAIIRTVPFKRTRKSIEFLPEPDYSGTSGTFEGRLSKLYPKDI